LLGVCFPLDHLALDPLLALSNDRLAPSAPSKTRTYSVTHIADPRVETAPGEEVLSTCRYGAFAKRRLFALDFAYFHCARSWINQSDHELGYI
jgi:hypothetical protein